MGVLKQNEECPALGTSTCPRRERDSNNPTTEAGVVLQVLQALQTWDGGFCKLSLLSQASVFPTLQEQGFQQTLSYRQGPVGAANETSLRRRQHCQTPGWAETSQKLDRNRVKPCTGRGEVMKQV